MTPSLDQDVLDAIRAKALGNEAQEAGSPNTSLKGQWIEEIDYAYEPELVEGLIPNAGVGVLFGPSSAGKSFIAIDWAVRMASGWPVLERHTVLSGVLYFAAEGHGGLRKRIYAVRNLHCVLGDAAPFNYLPAFLDLAKDGANDVGRLTDYAAGIAAEMETRGATLRVIIVDTLAAAAPSADENVSRDMGPIMQSFHRMAAQLGCVVMLVAHTGKDVARGLRGWSGIRANVDFAIECRVDKHKDTDEITGRRLWFEKCKDGPDGFVLAQYHLNTVSLGPKPSGEQDTTCWVDYSDPPKAPRESEIRAAQETRKEAQAEALRVQEKEQAEALRDQILGALTEYLTDQWRPLRETAEVIKHKGLVSLGVNALQGYLTSLADVSEEVVQISFNGTKIEIETTPKGGRFFRRFRVVKDD
jgi:RecA-family ATPase